MSSKLEIAYEMKQFDGKNRSFYRELTDEERKKFSNYLMIRWGSCVAGSTDLQEYYIISTNLRLNVNFFAASRHPELQWLMATTVSPGLGTFRHNWIAPKKRDAGSSSKAVKFLARLYPTMKMSDVELMATMTDSRQLKHMARDLGMTEEQIKKEL